MFIKELDLKFFGKFKYKQFTFKNGFNIIYGNNEAGKSTMHNFIEIMLYGFKNDKNVVDDNIYRKYRPWNSDQYMGSLSIDCDNKDFIIKNDFHNKSNQFLEKYKGSHDEQKVLNPYGVEPGEMLFGIDKSTFVNTLSIKQLGNATNEELAIEVKQKVKNLSQSKDDTISIDNILRKLDTMKNDAGDINNANSLLNQYQNRVKLLSEERDRVIDANKKTMELAEQKKEKEAKIQQIENNIKSINKELQAYKITVLQSKKGKVDKIYKEINDITDELSQYGEGNNIGIDDYEEALKLLTVLNTMRAEKQKLEKEMIEINRELVQLDKNKSNQECEEQEFIDLNTLYRKYLEQKEELKKINDKIINAKSSTNTNDDTLTEIETINKAVEKYNSNLAQTERLKNLKNDESAGLVRKLIKKSKINSALSIIATVLMLLGIGASVAATFYLKILTLQIGTISMAACFALFVPMLVIAIKSTKKIKKLKYELLSVTAEQNEIEEKLRICDNQNKSLLEEYTCESIDDLKLKGEEKNKIIELQEQKQKLIEADKEQLGIRQEEINVLEKKLLEILSNYNLDTISEESIQHVKDLVLEKDKINQDFSSKNMLLDSVQQKHNDLEKSLAFEEKRFNIILTTNNIKCIEEFKTIVNNNYKITQLKDKKDGLQRLIDNMLENYTYEQICDAIEKNKDLLNSQINLNGFSEDEKLEEIRRKEDEKSSIKKQIDSIESTITSREIGQKRLVVIEEEIEYYKDKIKESTENIKVINIAIENIKLISDYIKGDFVPLLKSAISENFRYVTSGNYKEVIIDEDINISVVNKDNEVISDLNCLSGGTLDQLYISLRLALSNLISENKKIPLILDDSFIQYDEDRLKKSLEMLAKESKKRQVILFTCQKREVDFAQEMNVECNIIKIS